MKTDEEPIRHVCGAWVMPDAICTACEKAHGLCPRCGKNRAPSRSGSRAQMYCSDQCRKATWEEGGIGIPRDTRYIYEVERDWAEAASCVGLDPELWFPSNGEYRTHEFALAMQTCARCPVKRECLTEGMQNDYGIWAGWTPEHRKQLKQRMERMPESARSTIIEVAAERGPQLLDN